MVESLKNHSSSLDTLSWRDGINSQDIHYRGNLGFLSRFVKLSHLEAPLAVLAQQPHHSNATVESIVENLPRSVQSLTMNVINDGVAYYRGCLDYMACNSSEHLNSLQEVKVIYHSLLNPPVYNWDEFGGRLTGRGVVFEFVHSISDAEVDPEDNWAPYVTRDDSDSSDSSGYEESLYSD